MVRLFANVAFFCVLLPWSTAASITGFKPPHGILSPLAQPHLSWESTLPLMGGGVYRVQIAKEASFVAPLVEDELLAVIARYVPMRPIPAGEVWWRVGVAAAPGAPNVEWSAAQRLTIAPPASVAMVPLSASFGEVQAYVSQAVAAAQQHGSATLLFEPGPRTLDPGNDTAAPGPIFLDLGDVSNLVIDGQDSSITFSGPVTYVMMRNCSKVAVSNFYFDQQPLPYTALRVLDVQDSLDVQDVSGERVGAASGNVTVELLPGHPPLESSELYATYGIAEVMDVEHLRTKRGVSEVLRYGGYARLEAGAAPRYALRGCSWGDGGPVSPPSALSGLQVGDAILIDPRHNPTVGFRILSSEEVVLSRLVVYACSNECFTSEHAEKLSILECGTVLQPGRFLAANNGGHNHHGARTGQWIEGGTWENAADDTVHVSGLVMSVMELLSPSEMWLRSSGPDEVAHATEGDLALAVGDKLQFFDRRRATVFSQRTITAIETSTVSDQRGTHVWLDGDAGAVVTGHITGAFNASITQVFNFNSASNQFVFRNNLVKNGRRVGVLYKGDRALIENNYFEGLGGGAVESWNAPYEGLCASSLVIRNNTVVDVCQLDRSAGPIWITAFGSGESPTCHRDVTITDNRFDSGPDSVFSIHDVSGVTISNNTIVRCEHDASDTVSKSNAEVVFDDTNDIQLIETPRLCDKYPWDVQGMDRQGATNFFV